MNLPHHRRYNWRIAYRSNRRALWLGIAALILSYLVALNIEVLELTVAKLHAENQIRTVVAVALRPPMGAPMQAHGDLELDSTWRNPQPVR